MLTQHKIKLFWTITPQLKFILHNKLETLNVKLRLLDLNRALSNCVKVLYIGKVWMITDLWEIS